MTIPPTDDKGKTAPIEQLSPAPPAEPVAQPEPEEREARDELQASAAAGRPANLQEREVPSAAVARPASPQEREVLFIPLAVNIGDGFKFGCGFFLALVLAMLVGFVVLAALFALNSVLGGGASLPFGP